MTVCQTTQRRILKLCEYMESLPRAAERHFHMIDFLRHRGGDHEHTLAPRGAKDIMTCGTTACALGWAATMPYFRRLGLRFEYGVVAGDDDIFNLTTDQWEELFSGLNQDKTPKAWARRARALVKQWAA